MKQGEKNNLSLIGLPVGYARHDERDESESYTGGETKH